MIGDGAAAPGGPAGPIGPDAPAAPGGPIGPGSPPGPLGPTIAAREEAEAVGDAPSLVETWTITAGVGGPALLGHPAVATNNGSANGLIL